MVAIIAYVSDFYCIKNRIEFHPGRITGKSLGHFMREISSSSQYSFGFFIHKRIAEYNDYKVSGMTPDNLFAVKNIRVINN